MSTTLILILVIVLLCFSIFMARQIKRYKIKRVGTQVMAKVVEVHSWQEPTIKDYSIQSKPVPLVTGGWQYEVIAEWANPTNEQTYIFTSERKKGLPSSKKGDYLPAYISPKGNYLELL